MKTKTIRFSGYGKRMVTVTWMFSGGEAYLSARFSRPGVEHELRTWEAVGRREVTRMAEEIGRFLQGQVMGDLAKHDRIKKIEKSLLTLTPWPSGRRKKGE